LFEVAQREGRGARKKFRELMANQYRIRMEGKYRKQVDDLYDYFRRLQRRGSSEIPNPTKSDNVAGAGEGLSVALEAVETFLGEMRASITKCLVDIDGVSIPAPLQDLQVIETIEQHPLFHEVEASLRIMDTPLSANPFEFYRRAKKLHAEVGELYCDARDKAREFASEALPWYKDGHEHHRDGDYPGGLLWALDYLLKAVARSPSPDGAAGDAIKKLLESPGWEDWKPHYSEEKAAIVVSGFTLLPASPEDDMPEALSNVSKTWDALLVRAEGDLLPCYRKVVEEERELRDLVDKGIKAIDQLSRHPRRLADLATRILGGGPETGARGRSGRA